MQVFSSRAREGEAACERETQGTRTTHSGAGGAGGRTANNDHTVVLKASADHAVAEFQRPGRRKSSGSVQHVVVNYPTVEYESIHREPTITQ